MRFAAACVIQKIYTYLSLSPICESVGNSTSERQCIVFTLLSLQTMHEKLLVYFASFCKRYTQVTTLYGCNLEVIIDLIIDITRPITSSSSSSSPLPSSPSLLLLLSSSSSLLSLLHAVSSPNSCCYCCYYTRHMQRYVRVRHVAVVRKENEAHKGS